MRERAPPCTAALFQEADPKQGSKSTLRLINKDRSNDAISPPLAFTSAVHVDRYPHAHLHLRIAALATRLFYHVEDESNVHRFETKQGVDEVVTKCFQSSELFVNVMVSGPTTVLCSVNKVHERSRLFVGLVWRDVLCDCYQVQSDASLCTLVGVVE